MSRSAMNRSNGKAVLWLVLAVPFAYLVWAYATERLFYGEVVHVTGELSVRLLIVAMAATPLALMLPGQAVSRWLMRHRRAFGVASFAYAALHTVVYVARTGLLADVLDEATDPGYLTAWVAFAAFTILALTSNDTSVRLLKAGWRRLHRLVYIAAVLVFAHWLLVAFNPGGAFLHLGVLAALEGYRVWKQQRIRRAARDAA